MFATPGSRLGHGRLVAPPVTEPVNAQSGTSYIIVNGDRGKLITAVNAAAQAYSIAQAGVASAFMAGWYVDIQNNSSNVAGTVTVSPATSTINGASTFPIPPGRSARIVSDGTNYQATTDNLSSITGSLGSDVNLTSQGVFVDGPSIAQGTKGTWFVVGTVTVADISNAAPMFAKLWDGTTVIASSGVNTTGAGGRSSMCLSGVITSPAGNLRISVAPEAGSPAGRIYASNTGLGKDSTITAIRIA